MTKTPEDGPTFVDPDTKVELNRILIIRSESLSTAETETVHKYWQLGHPQHHIAAMLGVHPSAIFALVGEGARRPDAEGEYEDPELDNFPL